MSSEHHTDIPLESVGQIVALESAILILWRQMPPALRATIPGRIAHDLKTIEPAMFQRAIQRRGLDVATTPRRGFTRGYERATRAITEELHNFLKGRVGPFN